jgi:hypothetical protein
MRKTNHATVAAAACIDTDHSLDSHMMGYDAAQRHLTGIYNCDVMAVLLLFISGAPPAMPVSTQRISHAAVNRA